MPEVPQDVVPEKKVPKAPPKKLEVPPVSGIFHPSPFSIEEIPPLLLEVLLIH